MTFAPVWPSLSIVIPVFNNQESLQTLIEQVGDVLRPYSLSNTIEVIFVDDASTDSSKNTIRNMKIPSHITVKLVEHGVNYGQLQAIYSGLRNSTSETIVHLTADLQDPTNLILDFLREYMNGYEIVYGVREQRADGYWRKFTSRVAYRIARIGNSQIPSQGFDYFLISRSVKDELIENYSQKSFLQGSILGTRDKHKGIPYRRERREFGKSQWTFRKKIRLLIDIVVESTFAPIRILSAIGFVIVVFSLLLVSYFLFLRLLGSNSYNGFTILALLIVTLGGMNLLLVGILAEYLIRLIKQSSGQNSFISSRMEIVQQADRSQD
jgi:polyisoprenyl-phosphate glycosyltransferase